MEQINSLNGIVQHLLELCVKKRIAVAVAENDNTIKSLFKIKNHKTNITFLSSNLIKIR